MSAVRQLRCVVCQTPYAGNERFCPIDGGAIVATTSGDATADGYVGKTIDGRYLVRRLIGKGGMGAVYEADHVGLDRRVALKLMLGRVDADALARFRREARAASKVVHANVVQIFDVGTDDDNLDYIVMEYLDGEDLNNVMRSAAFRAGTGFSTARAVKIVVQLLRGLGAIHAAGIVHRDIKPANVLLLADDVVKVTDFGIAKSTDAKSTELTETGHIIGTLKYMSPEQLSGKPPDPRTDLYATGLVLYEMLAGRAPFESPVDAQLAAMIMSEPSPSLANVRADASLELVVAIDRVLSKDPDDRYADADALIAALEAAPVSDEAVRAEVASPDAPTKAGSGRKAAAGPEAPTKVESKPGAAPKVGAAPDALTVIAAGPDDPTRLAAGPNDPTKIVAGPDDPTKVASGPDDPTKVASGPDAQTKSARAGHAPTRDEPTPTKATTPSPKSALARYAPWAAVIVVAGVGLGIRQLTKHHDDPGGPARVHDDKVLTPSEVEAEIAKARLAEDQDNLDLAIAHYRVAYATDHRPLLLYRIGDLQDRSGKKQEAAATLRDYLKAAPDAADRGSVEARIAALDPTAATEVSAAADASVPEANVDARPAQGVIAKTSPPTKPETSTALPTSTTSPLPPTTGTLRGGDPVPEGLQACVCIPPNDGIHGTEALCPKLGELRHCDCRGAEGDRLYAVFDDDGDENLTPTGHNIAPSASYREGGECRGHSKPNSPETVGKLEGCYLDCGVKNTSYVGRRGQACAGHATSDGAALTGTLDCSRATYKP